MSSPENTQYEPPAPLNSERQTSVPVDYVPPRFPPNESSSPAPIENPVWSGWDVLKIVGLTLLTMFVLQLMVVLAARRFAYPHTDLADLGQKPVLMLLSQFLLYIALATYMVLLVEGKYHARFWQAIHWNWPRSGWKLLALGALLLFGLNILQNFLPMPKDTPFEKLFAQPRDAYLISIIAVTIGPLMEELLFRGLLYPVLARRLGAAWGIFLTALPFGLMHLQQYGYAWGAVLVIFIVGVVCGVVRALTRSVAASFLVHVGYNGAQMLIAVLVTHGFRHMEKTATVLF